MNVGESVAEPDARRPGVMHRRVGLRGITAKIGAVVAALLAVFLLAGATLVYQAIDLARPDELRESLIINRRDSFNALSRAQEKISALRDVFLAGTDAQLRAERLESYEAADGVMHDLLEQMVAAATVPDVRAAFTKFQASHLKADATYDKALKAFLASGGRDADAADAATADLETKSLAELRNVNTMINDRITAETEREVSYIGTRITYIVVLGLLLLVGLAVAAAIVVRRVVRPIVDLTGAAEDVALRALPAAVAQIKTMEEGDEPPALDPITVSVRDETAQLARAFHALQASAVSLAVEQRQVERDSAEMLVNLGRRNQNLLNRTLAYITELERSEQDPEVLDRLFRLDHATTRIRRNAESMLVLAGATQTRTWSAPAPVGDVIRAALSEIEDYNRVDLYHVQEAGISGGAVADVVHLLAELMENAANFSPPSTQVTVVGQTVADGYRIRIIDEGIGMTRGELDAANRSIQVASDGRSSSKLLGLYVVGRLAARRGVEVTLEASGGRGVTANVVLPRTLLADLPAQPASDAAAARPAEADREPVRHDARRGEAERYAGAAVGLVPQPAASIVPAPTPASGTVPTPGPVAPSQAPAASSAPAAVPPPGVVQRVRGAQLPDLGPDLGAGPTLASIDAVDVRGRLSSLQAGVRAGREAQVTEPSPGPMPAQVPVERPADVAAEAVAAAEAVVAAEALAAAEQAAEEAPPAPVVPIRVRGAQLPDLGLIEGDPEAYLAPSAEANRWKLRSFQLDVDAARREAAERPPADEAGRPLNTSEEA